jgi:hypothetical protein
MSDRTTIIIEYAGTDVFNGLAGVQPMPYVTRSQEAIRYGDHWGQLSSFSINGQITGNASELFANKDSIVDAFKKDFQKFEVKDDGETILEVSGVIKSINFGDSKYYGLLDYSINIEAYEEGLFSGTWGILNPADQISYTDTEEGYIDITHTCSAKGFHTGSSTSDYDESSALKNAKDFVFSRRNSWRTKAKPIFASGEADFANIDPLLISSNESIDRFEGTYELTDTFRFSKTGLDPVMSKQSVSVESGIAQDAITVSIEGEIRVGKSGTMDIARTHLQNIKMLDTAQSVIPDVVTLYPFPINLDIREDEQSNLLTYSASYDNLPVFSGDNANAQNIDAYFDYSVSLNTDEITNITSATINGTVKGRGNIIHRRQNISKFYQETMESGNPNRLRGYLHEAAGDVYASIVGETHQLNVIPNSINVKSGNANGQIDVSAQFSDEDSLVGFSNVDYDISTKASMPMRAVTPSARFKENGHYFVTFLEASSREETSLKVNMTYDREYYATNITDEDNKTPNTLYQINEVNNNKLKTLVADLAIGYTPAVADGVGIKDPSIGEDSANIRLKSEVLTESRESRTMSASYAYTYHGSKFQENREKKGKNNYYQTFMNAEKNVTYLTTMYYK